MTPAVQKAFDTFAQKMSSAPISLGDIFEVQAGFLQQGQARIAAAMTNHMRDYLMQAPDQGNPEVSYASLLAEGYRRTFCDKGTAALYGTEDLAANEAHTVGMFTYLVQGLDIFDSADNKEHLVQALSADETNRH